MNEKKEAPPTDAAAPPAETDYQRQVRQGIAALIRQGVHGKCSRCPGAKWDVSVTGMIVTALPVRFFQVPPPHIPMLIVTCTRCGYTAFHSLTTLGVE